MNNKMIISDLLQILVMYNFLSLILLLCTFQTSTELVISQYQYDCRYNLYFSVCFTCYLASLAKSLHRQECPQYAGFCCLAQARYSFTYQHTFHQNNNVLQEFSQSQCNSLSWSGEAGVK